MQKITFVCSIIYALQVLSLVSMMPYEDYDIPTSITENALTKSIDPTQDYINSLHISIVRSSHILPEELHEPETIYDIPAYYTAITEILLKSPIQYSNRTRKKNRVLALKNWPDCRITAILCDNNEQTMAITSFGYGPGYDYKKDPQHIYRTIHYGITCPSEHTNPLTRRLGFKVIDALKSNWISTFANEYYTHPYKELPRDNPHEKEIDQWFFLSKRKEILIEEPALIRFLAARFGMSDVVTCRASMKNNGLHIAAVHIWILKTAIHDFNAIFDFEYR